MKQWTFCLWRHLPAALFASRYFACGDICLWRYLLRDICLRRYLLRDSGFVPLCLCVQKKCRRNMRRISIFYFQFCFLCLCGLVFSLSYSHFADRQTMCPCFKTYEFLNVPFVLKRTFVVEFPLLGSMLIHRDKTQERLPEGIGYAKCKRSTRIPRAGKLSKIAQIVFFCNSFDR
jgi:hypothetical protein